MKKSSFKIFIVLFCVIAFAISFHSNAEADEPKVPQYVQDYYDEHDIKLANAVWFPFTASTRQPQWPWNWETYIIISNFDNVTIQVTAWATNFGDTPTIKVYTLGPYEKKILSLRDWGYFNTIADIYLASGALIGATAIVFDAQTNDLLTGLAPIFR